ncbi:MAG: hypothetical protein FH756_00280 [Firmicutes bacterium]|nr:hypothetical protein [Bacillota bacterium]
MRLTKLIVLFFTLLLLPGMAFANPQEQFILHEIKLGSFDVWQHTDGTWQDTDDCGDDDPYGLENKKVRETYAYPESEYASQFTPTRATIDHNFTLTDDELANAGRSESWGDFDIKYLRYLPNSYSAARESLNLEEGTVTVLKKFDLEPELMDLKDPAVRADLGMDDRDFSNMAQGWRWYTPMLVTWYGVPKENQNLKAKITSIPSEDPNPGDSITITGQITNESDTPVTTLVQWYLDSNKVYEGEVTVDETRDLTFPFSMPDRDTLVTLQVNPGHNMPPDETTWEDNKDKVTINVDALEPIINDNLYLTATSQGGEDQFGNYIPSENRTPGTAKWTDIVTAGLKTRDAPDLGSCYRLKTWKLESATIKFPKRHPDFTFGSPVEPVEKTSKAMTITGDKTATVQFKEDWSLNGAQIYDNLKGQMVPGPTYYDIETTYTMLWEYRKGRRACCGEDDCRPCCVDWNDYSKHRTYTVKTKLLVNGTGVNSLAN